MAVRTRLSRRAVRDLQAIRAYLLDRSPKGADRVRRQIDKTIRLLGEHPGLGHPTKFAGIRAISTARYSYIVYHQVRADEITIVHIRHAVRDRPRADDLKA